MLIQLTQCLLLASVLVVATTSAQEVSGSLSENERDLHDLPNGEVHWHLEDLGEHYEDYYFHYVTDMSLSMMTYPPTDLYYYKGKGKGKGKGKMGMMKSKGSKGKKSMMGKKDKSHKKKGKDHDGYWYEYEHAPHKGLALKTPEDKGEEGYWYYHEHEHAHGDEVHEHEHEHEPEYYYYYYYYPHGSKGEKEKGGKMSSKTSKTMGKGKGKGKGKGVSPPTPNLPTTAPTLYPTSSPSTPCAYLSSRCVPAICWHFLSNLIFDAFFLFYSSYYASHFSWSIGSGRSLHSHFHP